MRIPSRAVAALAIALAACLPGAAAQADQSDADVVTWGFKPSGPDAPDTRSWVELTLAPGESATDYAELRNLSQREVTFKIEAADGLFTQRGSFTILPAGQESTDAGLWIQTPDRLTLAPGESAIFPFTVTAPPGAAPGDHPAGLAASVDSAGTDNEGHGVAVQSRVGFRVMTRVTGELVSTLEVDAKASFAGQWNPFEPGSVTVDYTVSNTGNTRLTLAPSAGVAGPFGLGAKTWRGEMAGELAPGETRTGSFTVRRVWPLGQLTVDLDFHPEATIETGGLPVGGQVEIAAVAVPWPQLALLVAGGGLFAFWLRSRRRAKRDVARRVGEALERGRRETEARFAERNNMSTNGGDRHSHLLEAPAGVVVPTGGDSRPVAGANARAGRHRA
ncbi:MAG: DUF916 domain-containing protein [Bifidobacteriaceae bacterium]|nr:DUF916 domain-containing protein [Bifidobacteriaceae bacterium]